jgi:hypothetical protein
MANLNDRLGESEQRHFMQLTGNHPQRVDVHTHRDALSYLRLVDVHKRKKDVPKPGRVPGLLAIGMGHFK